MLHSFLAVMALLVLSNGCLFARIQPFVLGHCRLDVVVPHFSVVTLNDMHLVTRVHSLLLRHFGCAHSCDQRVILVWVVCSDQSALLGPLRVLASWHPPLCLSCTEHPCARSILLPLQHLSMSPSSHSTVLYCHCSKFPCSTAPACTQLTAFVLAGLP